MLFIMPLLKCDFSQNSILPTLMEKNESVQYSAALAVTGTWRGTCREKLYTDLGWESLSYRRWSRHLTLFYKFVDNLAPRYTLDPIPPLHQWQYYLFNLHVIGHVNARTEKFKLLFHPNGPFPLLCHTPESTWCILVVVVKPTNSWIVNSINGFCSGAEYWQDIFL